MSAEEAAPASGSPLILAPQRDPRQRTADLAVVEEIQYRATAIRRNAEGALLDDLPVDAVLVSTLTLAGHIARWTRVLA